MDVTYKIIGADGTEYGPANLEEIRSWVLQGRVARGTQVWRTDLSRWGPASGYEELRPDLERVAAALGQTAFSDAEAVGFWPRVGAYLIDVMVWQGIFLAIWGPGPQTLPTTPSGLPDLEAFFRQMGPMLGYRMLIQMLYTVLLTGWLGATLGKLAVGARIVNIDGSRLGFGKAFLRWLATNVSSLTFGIGFLMVAFRRDKRALHDLLAQTRVIRRTSSANE